MTNDELTGYIEAKIVNAKARLKTLNVLLSHEVPNSHRYEVMYQMTKDMQDYIEDQEWTQNFWLFTSEKLIN